MTKKSTYVVTHDFRTPYVVSTNNPRNPTGIMWKAFKKGDLVGGELKTANGKPAFVLFNNTCVIPLSVIKAVVTKEIVSSATGPTSTTPLGQETTRKIVTDQNPKTRYMDAALVGAAIGLAGVYLANKKGWIKVPMNINFAYGAGIGAGLALYFIYRKNNNKKTKTI